MGRYPLEDSDSLRITSFNSASGVELAIAGRRRDEQGRIVPFLERHVPNTDRTVATGLLGLGAGELVSAVVRASAGAPRRGQCFVCLEIVRGRLGAVEPIAAIASGYVTDRAWRAFPGALLEDSISGPGVIRSVAGSDPAAGAEISETVPTNARWRLISLQAALVTDATAANRIPVLIVDDGTNELARGGHGIAQAASLTINHTFGVFGAALQVTTTNFLGMAPAGIVLMGGHRIRTSTAALQAGDNWGAPRLFVEEWIED